MEYQKGFKVEVPTTFIRIEIITPYDTVGVVEYTEFNLN